jgi:glucose-1-phosphate thymidylyltransferase
MKGIILAGGSGTRMWPMTKAMSKQLLPVYDKPMIYYPLSTLLLAGIQEILIITTPDDHDTFKRLLGSGSQIGAHFTYAIQEKPEGLAQAFTIGSEFIGTDKVVLILGDNIFHGVGLGRELQKSTNINGAQIFGYSVSDPERYGVAEVDNGGNLICIQEKPLIPKSNWAIPGLYFFDNSVLQKAASISKSARGEFEITSILNLYLGEDNLKIRFLPRGTAWMDCGTVDSLNDASNYVRAIEERQGLKIGVIEEIAWRNGWITREQLQIAANFIGSNDYEKYLNKIS